MAKSYTSIRAQSQFHFSFDSFHFWAFHFLCLSPATLCTNPLLEPHWNSVSQTCLSLPLYHCSPCSFHLKHSTQFLSFKIISICKAQLKCPLSHDNWPHFYLSSILAHMPPPLPVQEVQLGPRRNGLVMWICQSESAPSHSDWLGHRHMT